MVPGGVCEAVSKNIIRMVLILLILQTGYRPSFDRLVVFVLPIDQPDRRPRFRPAHCPMQRGALQSQFLGTVDAADPRRQADPHAHGQGPLGDGVSAGAGCSGR